MLTGIQYSRERDFDFMSVTLDRPSTLLDFPRQIRVNRIGKPDLSPHGELNRRRKVARRDEPVKVSSRVLDADSLQVGIVENFHDGLLMIERGKESPRPC
jgi:hypothetical protein